MNELPIFDLEERLRLAGANLTYPATPDIAGQVRLRLYGRPRPQPTRLRRLAWGAALVVILLAGLLAVPGVRAQVLEVDDPVRDNRVARAGSPFCRTFQI